jgi:hypothetical protein
VVRFPDHRPRLHALQIQIVANKPESRLDGTEDFDSENARDAGKLPRVIQKLFSSNRESCSTC